MYFANRRPERRSLVVVPLLEPDMCLSCRFRGLAVVELADGQRQEMTYCTRKDCDNWDRSSKETPVKIEVERMPE